MTFKNYVHRCCPICESKLHSKPIIKTKEKAENLSLKSLIPYWHGFFKEKIIFSYVRCSSCELLYCPIFFTNKQLKNLYSKMPVNMDIVPKDALSKTQYGYFNFLKKISPLDGVYLEIGPDIGLFTEHSVREGNFNKYWLFEPNRAVKNVLNNVVRGNKAKIIHEMTNFSDIPDKSVDIAIIIHVMDHLLDPMRMLKSLKLKLKDNSKILIVTHDESSLLSKIFGCYWPGFCLQHPQIYNRKTTKRILEASGFDVITQKKTVNYFKLQFLIKQLFWASGIKINSMPDFAGLIIGLKLGNILTIASLNQKKFKK